MMDSIKKRLSVRRSFGFLQRLSGRAAPITEPHRNSPYLQPTHDRFDTDGQLQALNAEGFVLIPGVLTEEEVIATREAIDELKPIHFDLTGQVDHYKCIFNRSPFWLPYLDRPGIIDLAERALGQDCHITGMTAWRSHPGSRGLTMHSDRVFFPVDEHLILSGQVVVPMLILTVFYYLSDITRDLCPTYIVRGTHKAGIDVLKVPKEKRDSWHGIPAEPVLCRAGDVLIMRSELWHSGASNQTADQVRYLLQVHYGNRFIAQRFTPYLSFRFDPEVLAAANPRQLRLLGGHVKGNYD
jgi:hypothetical protein